MLKTHIPLTALLILLLMSSPAPALDHNQLNQYVPQAKKVGQGRLSVMIWDVYDAALYAPEGRWHAGKPFALKLSYLREIEGERIADRSVKEIRAQGFTDEETLQKWHQQMNAIFPDVTDGTTLTGILTQTGESIFFSGDQEIGRIKDPAFGQYFFNIWLGERTRAPDLRAKLLGRS